MCGIAGFIDFNRKSDEEILLQMIKPLGHRGPDDEGTQLFDTTECQIGLAHKRLSILDISSNGHQPMTSKNERWHIVYNGEIYNYREIKKILIDEGYTFKTETDTEVILNSFDKWGPNAVEQFIGMFAFVIYDVIEKKIYVVRDRAGVKPLYYYQSDNNFLFASELKSFHHNPNFQKKIDFEALKLYFNYGYILAPHTIFKDTYKLLPGSF
ncbi:MAG: asparagine synthetase B, partial [Bacteroidetes bacterium B1(2017)]